VNKKNKERFKITIKDRKTGEKLVYNVHSAGFQFNSKFSNPERPVVVKMVLDYPRAKNPKK
jgi:hypothetical protein